MIDQLQEFRDPVFKARVLDERLINFSKHFVKQKPVSPIVKPISYSYLYQRFYSSFKPSAKWEFPKIFQSKIFGREGNKIRKQLFKDQQCVSFFGCHQDIISDIIDYADIQAMEKVNGGVFLYLDWQYMDSLKESNQIYNISYKSCVNRKGQFDAESWTFFFNTYLEFYLNTIHKYL